VVARSDSGHGVFLVSLFTFEFSHIFGLKHLERADAHGGDDGDNDMDMLKNVAICLALLCSTLSVILWERGKYICEQLLKPARGT
jgi:hypothetical protein